MIEKPAEGFKWIHFVLSARMEGYAIARNNGWMSANDIRALENQNPIPDEDGGNAYLVNGNMISVRRAAQNSVE